MAHTVGMRCWLCAVLVVLFTWFPAASAWTSVFSGEELRQCTRLRTPSLFTTPNGSSDDKPVLHVIARCCGSNSCSGKSGATTRLGDDNKDATVIMKSSNDLGASWSNFVQLSPNADGQTGYANAFGLWDNRTRQVVVQYVRVGSTSPAVNVSYYQITSSDFGGKWSAAQDVTSQLSRCSPLGTGNMMLPSAGSKVVTQSGRLVNPMHDHGGNGIVAFSDDGATSWSCSNKFEANEISVATNPHVGSTELYMNGRGGPIGYAPHRAEYFSADDGSSWVGPSRSELLGDDGCERSLRTRDDDGAIFSCEPTGHKRKDMVCSCSKDGGKTWPYNRTANDASENDHSGYNDIVIVGDQLIIVMEDNDNNNMLSNSLSTTFCG